MHFDFCRLLCRGDPLDIVKNFALADSSDILKLFSPLKTRSLGHSDRPLTVGSLKSLPLYICCSVEAAGKPNVVLDFLNVAFCRVICFLLGVIVERDNFARISIHKVLSLDPSALA